MGNGCLRPISGSEDIDTTKSGKYTATPLVINSDTSNNNNEQDALNKNFLKHKRKGGMYILQSGESATQQNVTEHQETAEEKLTPKSVISQKLQEQAKSSSDETSLRGKQEMIDTTRKVKERPKQGLNLDKNRTKRLSKSDSEIQRISKAESEKSRTSRQSRPPSYSLKQLRKDYIHDFQAFLLNNTLLAVNFGHERELLGRARATFRASAPISNGIDTRQNEMCSRLAATGHYKRAICPDALHEQIANMVRYNPPSAPGSIPGIPLRPIRVMICHEDIDVVDQEHVYSSSRHSEQIPIVRLGLEQTPQPGFVKLRDLDSKATTPARSSMTGSYDEIEESYSGLSDYAKTSVSCDVISSSSSSDEEFEADDICAPLPPPARTVVEIHEPAPHISVKDLTEKLHNLTSAQLDDRIDIPSSNTEDKFTTERKFFGPQNPNKQEIDIGTPTERRLSGMLGRQLQRRKQLMVPTTQQKGSNSSNDSSGYKSGGSALNVPSSHRSTDSDSEYGYTTIANLNTPLTLQERRQKMKETGAVLKLGFDKSCFVPVTFRYLSDDETNNDLFQTKRYLSSNYFMGNFCNVFAEILAKDLGFAPNAVNNATVCGATITCKTATMKLDIIPVVNCANPNWPEKATEWLLRQRTQALDQRTGKTYTWPTRDMIQNARRFGYHLVPFGFAPRRGANPSLHLEWTIEFPEAEKYLESCLKHAQLRCYIFCLILFQAFFSVPDGVKENHIRHILFWQAENLTLTWANFEMFNNIRAVFGYLYTALSKQNLPNYFIRRRNEFQSITRGRLHIVQRNVHQFRENPFGHVIAALKSINLVNNPYPVLDYDALLRLIKSTYDVELINPLLNVMPPPQEIVKTKNKSSDTDSDGFWNQVKRNDPQKLWNERYHRKVTEERKIVTEKNKVQSHIKPENIPNHPPIEVNVSKFHPSSIRRRLILELFMDHFIKLARKSLEFKLRSQTREYLSHTENLYTLFEENGDHDERKLRDYRAQLDDVIEGIINLPIQTPVKPTPAIRRDRKPLELPKEATMYPSRSAVENWMLRDSDFSEAASVDLENSGWNRSSRLMRDAPPTIIFINGNDDGESTDL